MSTAVFERQAIKGVYEHAAALAKAGRTKAEVCDDLKSRGLNVESASVVADGVFELRTKTLKESGQLNMLYGSLLCIGGSVVMTLMYLISASASGTGYDVVVWGAVVLGAMQFFRGLGQTVGMD